MADLPPTPKGEVSLPGIGKVDKKYALGGAAVAVALVVVVMIRKRSAASAAAAAGTASTDTTGTDPSIDPATGIPYAQEQADQQAQLASLGGAEADYGGAGGAVNGGYDAAGYPLGSVADLAWEAQQQGVTPVSGSTGAVTTNSQWLTEAEGVLPGDTATIQTALSMVLGGITVTTAQKNLFLEAVGVLGNPPGGYPQPIKTSDTAAAPTASGTSTPTGSVSGLRYVSVNNNSATMAWNRASGATQYTLKATVYPHGAVAFQQVVGGTQATITGLKPNTKYEIDVWPNATATGQHAAMAIATKK